MAWCRELSAQRGGTEVKVEEGGEGDRFYIDKLLDRSEPELTSWIYGAAGDGRAGAWVDQVGELSEVGAGVRVLRTAASRLIGFKVWRVGELLGRTLVELANEEERRGREIAAASVGVGEEQSRDRGEEEKGKGAE